MGRKTGSHADRSQTHKNLDMASLLAVQELEMVQDVALLVGVKMFGSPDHFEEVMSKHRGVRNDKISHA